MPKKTPSAPTKPLSPVFQKIRDCLAALPPDKFLTGEELEQAAGCGESTLKGFRRQHEDCSLLVKRPDGASVRYWSSPKNVAEKKKECPIAASKGAPLPVHEPPPIEPGITTEIGEETGRIESIDYEIRTVEQALKRAEIDLAVWEAIESKIGSHEVGMKMRRRSGNTSTTYPIKRTLWHVSVKLRRKIPKNIYAAFEALYAKMEGHEPNYKLPKLPKIADPHMLEASLVDEHFAMLAWGDETGEDYDMKIAERIYLNAVQDILVRTQGYPVEQVLFPVGNDYFHVDNAQNRTVNGTALDADSRYGKMIELGTMAIIRAIDMLMQRAKLKVIWIPGNHDRTTSYHLVRELKAWYRNCDRIEVDAGPKVRKYEHYGATLLGFTHGDMEPHRDLPTIMASEVPQLWAETTDHVWHIGHFHKKKEMRHTAADSFGSCRISVLPSLVSRDAWHFSSGYVGGKRSAEAYLWSKATGYTGHFSVNAR